MIFLTFFGKRYLRLPIDGPAADHFAGGRNRLHWTAGPFVGRRWDDGHRLARPHDWQHFANVDLGNTMKINLYFTIKILK